MILAFNQVVDIEKNSIWQYESEMTIPDLQFETNYLIKLAKKRNRIVELERFHITKVLDFLVIITRNL